MPPPPIPPNKPPTGPAWPIPKLSLRVDDLSHPGVAVFFSNVDPQTALRDAVIASFTWLYTPEKHPTHVQNVLLILRPMPGVAHTTGTRTDKEIHVSLDYIASQGSEKGPGARDEIRGVLTHEAVHCFQYDGEGTCPGGLIEGTADWVRLHAGFAPSHWNPAPGETWDAGYQATAYFLDWLEKRYGAGTVRELNASLSEHKYKVDVFKDLTGRPIGKLWKLYCEERGVKQGLGRKMWDESVVYIPGFQVVE